MELRPRRPARRQRFAPVLWLSPRRTEEEHFPVTIVEADARIRTADPFITSEVLYQLSYVGGIDKA